MSVEFLDYIEDMLDAMEKAEILLQDVSYEQFAGDFRIHFVVVRALEIVWNAVKQEMPQVKPLLRQILANSGSSII